MKNSQDMLIGLRKIIDQSDNELLHALSKRQKAVAEIGKFKKENNLPALDHKRWQEVINSRIKLAKKIGLPESLIKAIYEAIHKHSLEIEK